MSDLGVMFQELRDLDVNMKGTDFLLTWEKSEAELRAVLKTARILKELHRLGLSTKVFDSGLAVSLFRDNSTRTRFSFASACNLLGLEVQDLDEGKSQVAHGETVRETATMISFLTDVIGIRDDMFLGLGNSYMKEVAAAVEESYQERVLPQRPTLVNLQCDLDHPTQSTADLLHLEDVFGGLNNLRGKTLAMTWAYSPSYGKPLSVPQGIIALMSRFGMNIRLAHPEGYGLVPEVVETARGFANESGGSFEVMNSMEDAFKDADIVYPKSWAPFAVMGERSTLLQAGDQAGLKDLEKRALAQNAKHTDWECTDEKMALTRNGDALYMHCLPADITGVSCKQGEVSASTFERYRLRTYAEAGYKPFSIAAMILHSQFADVPRLLGEVVNRNEIRRGL